MIRNQLSMLAPLCTTTANTMTRSHPNDPLHGITLKSILEELVERRGWEDLAAHVDIRCFVYDPSIKSSLIFLRKNPWARSLVEALYLADLHTPTE